MSQEKQTAEEVFKKHYKVWNDLDIDNVLEAMEAYATLKLQEQAQEIERLKGEILGFKDQIIFNESVNKYRSMTFGKTAQERIDAINAFRCGL